MPMALPRLMEPEPVIFTCKRQEPTCSRASARSCRKRLLGVGAVAAVLSEQDFPVFVQQNELDGG